MSRYTKQCSWSGALGAAIAVVIFAMPAIGYGTDAGAPRVLPSWSLADINGQMVDFHPLEANTHRVVLFWATWCPYCKALMPHLEKMRQARQASDLEFLALNIWEDGDAKAYVDNTGFKFRLIPNADDVAKAYGVKGTPGLFLVNQHNQVLYERRSGTAPEQVVTDLEFILDNQ